MPPRVLAGVFVVEEQAGDGVASQPAQFRWDAATHSAPQRGWPMPGMLRTQRDDFPGSTEVAEQVLGSSFEQFTLEGRWDDRWAGADFANKTWKAFEALCLRGSLCKFTYQDVQIYGLIVKWNFNYRRKWDIGYSFTVSPHYRQKDSRPDKVEAAQASRAPDDFHAEIELKVATAQSTNALAPLQYINGDLFANTVIQCGNMAQRTVEIADVLESRVLHTDSASTNSVTRLQQSFQALKFEAQALADMTRPLRATDDIALGNPVIVLAYESWKRRLATQARAIIVLADTAAKELARRVTPDAIALYRPHHNENLYSVSNKFFKTPFRWREIAVRNNLQVFTLSGTELLVIPGVR